ncbi:hypothetical protein CALVIDRAFT_565293 [Calocera viscosa TUFC12733]|uniref:SKP1 component POZ domain-containing protein n=1 Tax=Calocera viscosa (strain TUFC12733) TaxID=1330018 RepID=A0A167KQC0_CALVF|nr:hypothetical protein CALVIDRAFT_565293 [Calocera viscosa TUFC12733]
MSVILLSQEGHCFEISKAVADRIGVVRDCVYGAASLFTGPLVAEYQAVAENDMMGIPLHKVSSVVLAKVLIWCKHYEEAVPLDCADCNQEFPDWDMAYIGNSVKEILLILQAADYLDIPGLMYGFRLTKVSPDN